MTSKKEIATGGRNAAALRSAVEAQKNVARFQKGSLERFIAAMDSPAAKKILAECDDALGSADRPGYLMAGDTKANVFNISKVLTALRDVAVAELAKVEELLVAGRSKKPAKPKLPIAPAAPIAN